MKKIVFTFVLLLSFIFCNDVLAATVDNYMFFVNDQYVTPGNLCESDSDIVTVTKDGTNCVINFVKAGSFSVNVSSATTNGTEAVAGEVIYGTVFDSKYKITTQQLVDYINNPNSLYAASVSAMMMAKDYKPADATAYTFSASLTQDGFLYRFGYDTDMVELTMNPENNMIYFSHGNSTVGTTPEPATEYTSTKYTVGLTALFFFMSEGATDGDTVIDILSDDEKYALVRDDINTIYKDYLYTKSNVVDSENYSFEMKLALNGKVNADIIALYNSKISLPDSGENGAEPAPEEEDIVNPETGLFVSVLIIAFMGLVSLVIMNINKNRIYRI